MILKKRKDTYNKSKNDLVNKFEIEFFKIISNTVYGKTMKNLRCRVDLKLLTIAKRYEKIVS